MTRDKDLKTKGKNGENIEFPTCASTGLREKAPADRSGLWRYNKKPTEKPTEKPENQKPIKTENHALEGRKIQVLSIHLMTSFNSVEI